MARWCPNREETHLADDDGPLWGVATGGGQGSKGEGVTGARPRARLDECTFVIDGTIETVAAEEILTRVPSNPAASCQGGIAG
jgi:hypothetical protein